MQRDFTPSSSNATHSIAAPARPMARTGQFEPETMRVMAQTDAEWIAEYDGGVPLVQPPVAHAILRPSLKGTVHSNTLNVAVQVPTEESGTLLCPEFSNAAQCRIHDCGLGAMVRKAIGVATFTFETPSPPDARSNAEGGFSVHVGTKMKPTTTGTPAQSNHYDHIALTQRATNSLSMALYHLRQAEDHEGIRKATGRAISAARYLKQLAGGAQ